ncbi:MAG: two-component sensor histidine kinase [Desulfobacteraceae bacterium IS3]|nr:MAG: two-component sensor histidine kinase [Desulfobacteraceae bacterium IS3]
MKTNSYNYIKKLQTEIIAVVLFFSLIPLFALGSFLYFQFAQTYTQKVTNNLRTIVDNKKKALDMFFEERISQLKTIAYTHSYKELSDENYLRGLLSVLQTSSNSLIDLGIINQQGEQIAYMGPYNLKGLSYKNELWFHEVMFKELYISDVFMGFRRFPHFIIAVMRKEADSFWILRATIDSNIFNLLVQSVQIAEKGDAYLLNSENILQTPSRFGKQVMEASDFPRTPLFTGTAVKEELSDQYRMIVGMSWLEKKNWLLVVSEDPAEAMVPLFRTRRIILLLIAVGIMLIATGAFILSRAIIKELIRSERQKAALDSSLMQSSKMAALGKLAAGVAHELNNPLALIKESAGWLKDLLEEEDPDKIVNFKEIDKTVNKIDVHVERAKSVTHRMLGFGRRFEPVQEDMDLNRVAEQTLGFLENEALHRNIAIEKNYLENLPSVRTDTAQIQQVILNIADNAIDAVGKNGTVGMKTGYDSKKKEVFLEISDTGPGIPKEDLDKIFDPFYTTKTSEDGTGLGLSISYSIIEKLGGRISVESTPGKGSVFTVYLPAKK